MYDHIVEGEDGWVLQGLVSRASFRRAAASGPKGLHGVVVAHQQCLCQEKRHCQESHSNHSRYYDFSRH